MLLQNAGELLVDFSIDFISPKGDIGLASLEDIHSLDYPTFDMNLINKEKKAARHKLIQSFVLNLKVKPEFPVEKPAIFCCVDAEEDEPVDLLISGSTKIVWTIST